MKRGVFSPRVFGCLPDPISHRIPLPPSLPIHNMAHQLNNHLAGVQYSITPNMSLVGHGTMDYRGDTPAQHALYTETINGTLPASLAAYGSPMPTNYLPSYFLFRGQRHVAVRTATLDALQLFVQVNNLLNKTAPFAGGENECGPANLRRYQPVLLRYPRTG